MLPVVDAYTIEFVFIINYKLLSQLVIDSNKLQTKHTKCYCIIIDLNSRFINSKSVLSDCSVRCIKTSVIVKNLLGEYETVDTLSAICIKVVVLGLGTRNVL